MKISIITATLNSGQFLKECIESALRQGTSNAQHILVDGGSTDDTLRIAEAYPHLEVAVRPGCSTYDAWNIGLDIASGNLIGFCNSDDFYAPLTFDRVRAAAASYTDALMISGKAVQIARGPSGDLILADYFDPVPHRPRFEDLNILDQRLTHVSFPSN